MLIDSLLYILLNHDSCESVKPPEGKFSYFYLLWYIMYFNAILTFSYHFVNLVHKVKSVTLVDLIKYALGPKCYQWYDDAIGVQACFTYTLYTHFSSKTVYLTYLIFLYYIMIRAKKIIITGVSYKYIKDTTLVSLYTFIKFYCYVLGNPLIVHC